MVDVHIPAILDDIHAIARFARSSLDQIAQQYALVPSAMPSVGVNGPLAESNPMVAMFVPGPAESSTICDHLLTPGMTKDLDSVLARFSVDRDLDDADKTFGEGTNTHDEHGRRSEQEDGKVCMKRELQKSHSLSSRVDTEVDIADNGDVTMVSTALAPLNTLVASCVPLFDQTLSNLTRPPHLTFYSRGRGQVYVPKCTQAAKASDGTRTNTTNCGRGKVHTKGETSSIHTTIHRDLCHVK
jgi:hypothetical protein